MGHDDLDKSTKSDSLKETQILSKLATLDIGTLLAGRFKIQSLEGCGRFGCVYKAIDLQLDSEIAIKVLHQHLVTVSTLRDFKNEILTLRQLSHSNIVRVHEYYEDNNIHFITMDWIEGETLRDWLAKRGKLPKETVDNLVEQLISALQVTESKAINHKDLKPENILIDSNQQLYIADFGIASAIGDQASAVVTGTPLYSPPEYLVSGETSTSIDIYAFGLIVYELTTSGALYQAQTQDELIEEKQRQTNITLPKEFSVYKTLIQRCIAPLAESRPQSASELKQLIQSSSDKTKDEYSAGKLLIVAVVMVAIVTGGIYIYKAITNDNSLNNNVLSNQVTNEQSGKNSLTVLPFETKANSTEQWLSEGLPVLLSDGLSQASYLRVVGYERSKKTLDLLGYQLPLDDSKLKVISDLTQSPYILSTKLIPIGANLYQVNSQLIEVSGNSVTSSPLLQFKSSKEQLSQELPKLVAAVHQYFDLDDIDTTSSIPASINLESLLQIEASLYNGDNIRAKEKLITLLESSPQYAKGWLQLGQIEAAEGNLLEAESALQQALEYFKERSLLQKKTNAELQLIAGDIEAAIKTYQSILKQLPNNSDIRFDLAQLFIEQQSLEQAEQELITIIDSDENHPLAWYELSKVAIWQGKAQEAVDNYLVKALVTAKKLKNTQLEGDVLNAFGVAYHRLGQLDMSLDYYQQGLASREKVSDNRGVVTSLSNLASVYAVKGEYQLAEESLLRALKVNESRNDAVKQADLFNELGVIAEEQGLYSKALEHFQASLSIRMKLDDDWLKAESLNNVAYIFFLLSDEEQATIYWEQAKAYYEKVDDPVGIIRVKENMAQLELQKGNWQKAYQLYQSALTKAEEINLLEETIVAKAYLAKIAFLQGNLRQPLEQLKSIKKELAERQDIRGQVEFGLWLIDWSISTGDYEQAQTILTELVPLVEQENNDSQKLMYEILSARLNLYQTHVQENDAQLSVSQIPQKVTSKVALEALIFQLEQLAFSSSTEKEALSDIIRQFEEYDLELHKYFLLRKLLLSGYTYARNDDVDSLKTVLNQLVVLKRGSGTYWRNYQIERLQSIYYSMVQNSSQADDSVQRAIKNFKELKQQLPEQQQQHFISLQGRYYQNDQFMEQINDKER